MKNNIRGLLIHLIISAMIFFIVMGINENPILLKIIYNKFIFRIILIIFFISLYYIAGKLLSKRESKSMDFFTGNLIFLITLILIIISFIGLNNKLFEVPLGSSIWNLPLDLFLFPEIYIIKLLKIDYNIISVLLISFLPNVIYGISLKISRIKMDKKNKLKIIQIKRNRKIH